MRVLVTGDVLVDRAVREFEEHDVAVIKKPGDLSEGELAEAVKDVDGYILGGSERVTGQVIESARKLRAVVFWGTQPETFISSDAMGRMRERGITLETTGSSVNAAAEMTAFLIGAALRDIPYLVREVQAGRWVQKKGSELGCKTVGIVGLGKIGRAVAKKLSGFDLQGVLYYDVRRNEEAEEALGVKFAELMDLLASSDIISLHSPLLPQTKGMIGKEQFEQMKPTAILINTARPQLVDPDALYDALKNGEVGKAVFDGYYAEGTGFSLESAGKLMSLPITRFWFTPHVAFNTKENDVQQSEVAFEMMIQVLSEQSAA